MATTPDPKVLTLRAGSTVLELDADDLITLRSVLDAQIACEAEVNRSPVYSSAALTRSGGNFPRRVPLPLTVQQAMAKAVDTGVRVVLTLNYGGEIRRHVCLVDRLGTFGDATVFAIEPGILHLYPEAPMFAHVHTGGKHIELPLVTACSPAPAFASEPEVPSAAEIQEEISKVFVIAERLTIVPDDDDHEACEVCSGTGDDPPLYWNGHEDSTCTECSGTGRTPSNRLSVDSGYVDATAGSVTLRVTVGDRKASIVVSGLDFGDSEASANRALPPFFVALADDMVARGFGGGAPHASALGNILALARDVADNLIDLVNASDSPESIAGHQAHCLVRALDRFEAGVEALPEPPVAEPTDYPEPDREGWYWAKQDRLDDDDPCAGWKAVNVVEQRRLADSGERVDHVVWSVIQGAPGSVHEYTWGPRIDPPGHDEDIPF